MRIMRDQGEEYCDYGHAIIRQGQRLEQYSEVVGHLDERLLNA